MRFSQRKGLSPLKAVLQTESIDTDLRNSIWSVLCLRYFNDVVLDPFDRYADSDSGMRILCSRLWLSYFKHPLDTLPKYWSEVYNFLRNYYFKCTWFEVYDFIEFVASEHPHTAVNENFKMQCNKILERELSAYRFVDDKIVEITSAEEISEIKEALGAGGKLQPAASHLKTALEFLSDKKSPDYRNSIKESISAVEATCKILTGSKANDLTEALRSLKNKVHLHPALEQAFVKIYAYTSDENGIRHALMSESNLRFEDAKFMLVACSAFINYLTAKLAKA